MRKWLWTVVALLGSATGVFCLALADGGELHASVLVWSWLTSSTRFLLLLSLTGVVSGAMLALGLGFKPKAIGWTLVGTLGTGLGGTLLLTAVLAAFQSSLTFWTSWPVPVSFALASLGAVSFALQRQRGSAE